MKKKFFLYEYFLEGLILAAAATDYIPLAIFLPMFAGVFGVAYWRDGFQATTLYYIPFAIALIIGQFVQIDNFNAYLCVSVVLMQYIDSPVYQLPQNKKLVGFRKEKLEDGQESFEFYPTIQSQNAPKREMRWDQGRAFEKIVASKDGRGIVGVYHRISLSYIQKMTISIVSGEEKQTKAGMVFCHGRDAAPMWYSSLLIHFASNNFKTVARQHPSLQPLLSDDKQQAKKLRQKELQLIGKQYYEIICKMNCEKLVLVAHSYGCSALLQAYHTHREELSSKVTHIILLDPYLFPLPDSLLTNPVHCPVLVLANEYLLNFEDVYERHRILTSKKNVTGVVWKEGSDLYQTDLCFFFQGGKTENWESKFQMNLQAIDAFMQGKQVEGAFGVNDLGKQFKPESFLPEKLFIF